MYLGPFLVLRERSHMIKFPNAAQRFAAKKIHPLEKLTKIGTRKMVCLAFPKYPSV